MSALYGRLQGQTRDMRPSRSEATRQGHGSILAIVENWTTAVHVELYRDGRLVVRCGPKGRNPRKTLLETTVEGGDPEA